MKYLILDNQTGVLLNRTPEKVKNRIVFEFENALDGMVAVINTGTRVIYRTIKDSICEIENNLIEEGKLRVMVKAASPGTQAVICDNLFAVKIEGTLVLLGDASEREEIIRVLRKAVSALEKKMEEAEKIINSLQNKYEEIFAGHEAL